MNYSDKKDFHSHYTITTPTASIASIAFKAFIASVFAPLPPKGGNYSCLAPSVCCPSSLALVILLTILLN